MSILPDILTDHLDLLICGSAASSRSAELRQYYAGPGNKFWRTLATVGLTPHQLEAKEFRLLLNYNIGLTDVVKQQFGMDHQIDFRDNDNIGLQQKIETLKPKIVCFNGKQAAKTFYGVKHLEYGIQTTKTGASLFFVAPSTSGAANASWNIDIWQQVADLTREKRA